MRNFEILSIGLPTLAIAMLSSATTLAAQKADVGTAAIPDEVQNWIKHSHQCWGIKNKNSNNEKLRCSSLESRERGLREKYKFRSDVLKEIDQVTNKYNDVD